MVFARDGLAPVVVAIAAKVPSFGHGARTQVGETGNHHAGGFTAGVRVDEVDGLHMGILAAAAPGV